jgi:hypothetical protein
MKNKINQNKSSTRICCKLLAIVFLFIMTGYASADIIPSDRRIIWQGNVGVSGDIPARTTICARITASSGDRTSTIQNAINNCPSGQVVLLGVGTFNISSLDMKSNVTLRGTGIGQTILKGNDSRSPYLLSFYNGAGRFGTSYNLSGGYTKGSTSISTAAPHGWSAGDIILIDQLANASGNPPVSSTGAEGVCTWCSRNSGTRPIGQVVRLSAASGNSATLEIPLYWSFDSGSAPQGTKISIGVSFAGAEDLTIDNSSSWNDNQTNNGTVLFLGASNCWLLRIDVYGVWKTGIMVESAYRNTIRSSRVRLSHAYTSNAGYALWMTWASSANLVEDSIFNDLANGPIFNGPTSGNVIAYNYLTNFRSTEAPNTVRPGLVNHGAHPMMNLWEGNYLDGCYMAADYTWGTSSHNSLFRNRVFYKLDYTGQRADVILLQNNTYYNAAGNVIGTRGYESIYESSQIPYAGDAPVVWVLEAGGGSYGNVRATLLRHGNWDSVTNNTVWDQTIPDRTIPQSLYLSGKPSWWGSSPWPAIGPDLSPMAGQIPAMQRLPAPPTNLHVVIP